MYIYIYIYYILYIYYIYIHIYIKSAKKVTFGILILVPVKTVNI